MPLRRIKLIAWLPLALALGGCNFVVLDPTGDIAAQQRDLLLVSTLLMLLIILPVMGLTIFFAWKYRASNTAAPYDPEWSHSTQMELIIWSAPLLIIICLGALTWMGTHLLDPYRPLDRLSAEEPVPDGVTPLDVEVVALDWKWLFIYPEQGIATVNDLAAPVGRPLRFRITASSVMNAFYVPTLAGMIYAMPSMRTELHAVANSPVDSRGFSSNYSGAGFSQMYFRFRALPEADFQNWVAEAKASDAPLTRAAYLDLERPSENVPVRRYSTVDATLFDAILNLCVEPGKMCMSDMMAIDAKGGLGLESVGNVLPLTYDKHARRGTVFGGAPSYVVGICTPEELSTALTLSAGAPAGARSAEPVRGAGLPFRTLTLPTSASPLVPISLPASGALAGPRRPSNS
ncbi:ubiquinol oxidase subunit II [Ancylobacter dichloromethanicus]|uniref:Ubiquinol oxidase polypeptide II n=1 Tax=Ancylobacter dichloromethanicus TaxID=518825 RepID=A0A9W6N0M5_9HYPH|nr:ubiquinol oxidase subunit II [Ancylobacter dichloromethanicus]MBS7554937.1 ubiquinol oxidase subunit II [Ancylobacter dichloromethanicus]GLK73331.1 cytochrome ubiquinol oxidase subunit II [Ancylobacter dichloromethanicus]